MTITKSPEDKHHSKILHIYEPSKLKNLQPETCILLLETHFYQENWNLEKVLIIVM
jgi:hypothetical protein